MPLLAKAKSLLRNLLFTRRVEEDLDREVRSHFQMLVDERIRAGMGRKEAERAARMELGGAEQVKEQVREEQLGHWLHSVVSDCRFGLRQLAKNRGFTLTVVLTLALSVGANTAIFSLVNALLLKSLPYAHPERMGTIYTRIAGSSEASDKRHNVNGEQWELLRDNVPALISAVSGGGTSGVNLKAGSHVEYVHAGRVSAHYFDVLALEVSARLIAAHYENRRDVEASRRHQMRGRRFVARRQAHHAVELCAFDRNLHVVDDEVAARQHIAACGAGADDEVARRGSTDLERHAAGIAHGLLDDLGDAVEVAEADRQFG